MPKIPRAPIPQAPVEYETDDEVDEGGMEEELEEEEKARGRGRPPKRSIVPLPQSPGRRQPVQPSAPQAPRYTSFTQQAAEGIADAETKEVIATDIWTALANIMERLERIENSIGSMLEG